jgi:hypothetical protein
MQERMVMLQYYHEANLVGPLQIFKFFYHIFFSVLNKMKLSPRRPVHKMMPEQNCYRM